ncbi:hypothetical protein AB0958_22060 [Streptomyces sp. NPDC006655]|uniref:hypothetical protein n=1 Tax=Streptomyces sp. NPDC006655 TaxID=3156898 RepID=UPI0034551AA4
MRTEVVLRRNGEEFVVRLTRSQVLAMREALTFLRHRDLGEHVLALQLGTTAKAVDGLVERLDVDTAEPVEVRFRWDELHTVHAALTSVATMFLSDGRLSQEAFRTRLGFFRENLDGLALGIADAVREVAG